MQQSKKKKLRASRFKGLKKEVNLSLFTDIESIFKSYTFLLKNEFSKFSGHIINTQKSTASLHIGNE